MFVNRTLKRCNNVQRKYNHLTWWLEDGHLLEEEQCGFRLSRGTLDVLAQLEYRICNTYRKREVITALFVDLEGVFDCAAHWFSPGLDKILPDRRTYRVAVGASHSLKYSIQRDMPQSSILSRPPIQCPVNRPPYSTSFSPSHACRWPNHS